MSFSEASVSADEVGELVIQESSLIFSEAFRLFESPVLVASKFRLDGCRWIFSKPTSF